MVKRYDSPGSQPAGIVRGREFLRVNFFFDFALCAFMAGGEIFSSNEFLPATSNEVGSNARIACACFCV